MRWPVLAASALGAILAIAPTRAQVPVPAAPGADDLFDPGTLHDISLTVNTRDWADLQARYRENTYYIADLRWRDQVVRNVGIRSRGTGSRSGEKPGLRVDFNRYASGQKFLGLKSLVLDNLAQDPSMLKERVVMRFFNEMGVAAPRVVHARLFVNNRFAGLYTVVESVDKDFLDRSFGEDDGYLYEFHYTDRFGFEYLGSELERYAGLFEPKTHEFDSMAALYQPIRELTWAVSESPDSSFVGAVNAQLDLRTFLTHVAVENFLADIDGVIGDWGMNNFYLYRFEDGRRSQLVPWDKDSSFWAVDHDIWHNVETNVLMRRAMNERPLREIYIDALRRCAQLARSAPEPVRPGAEPADAAPPGWLEREVAFVYAQIREAGLADTYKPLSNERFEEEYGRVLDFARMRSAYVLHETDER
jgi:spore coat protein CotH